MDTRLYELRKEKHLSQIQLQIELGIDQSDISKIESGQKEFTAEQCKAAALFFHTSMDYILCLTNERQPHARSPFAHSYDYWLQRRRNISHMRGKEYTQTDIGHLLHMDQSNVSKAEHGKRYFSINQYRQLATLFHTSIDYLCGLTDDCSPYESPD